MRSLISVSPSYRENAAPSMRLPVNASVFVKRSAIGLSVIVTVAGADAELLPDTITVLSASFVYPAGAVSSEMT